MNIISINRKAIVSNYEFLQSLQPHAAIFPVLKSNAYGHGLVQMVKILRKTDAPYIAVDSFPEYQIVKKYSNKQILLLGETLLENYRKFNAARVTFCVYNKKTIIALGELNKDINIHLFLNTGMNREGIQEEQLDDILLELKKYPQITVGGVMSHLYSADEVDYDGIEEQIKKYRTMYYKLIDYGHAPIRRHIGNSAGMFKIQDDFFNAYRPGIALYGYSPFASHAPLHKKAKALKPALSITSRVISTQIARPGE
jgi:alanine racemase